MLNIRTIAKNLFPEGNWTGIPCVIVTVVKDAPEMEMNAVVKKILDFELKHILIRGSLTQNPELVTIIAGLTNKGKLVTLVTDGDDSIESVRRYKNIRVFLRIVPPTSETNQINPKNLPLLMDSDEIKLIIKNMEDYTKAKEFLKMKLITRPTVLFSLSDDTVKPLEIVEEYLKDTLKFRFKNRISKGIKL